MNRTRTALPLIAPFFRPGQIGMLAKRIKQRRANVELEVVALAIDLQR
jgi:hypothetical protein